MSQLGRRLVLIGGGEHARVVVDAARSRPDAWSIEGYVDLAPSPDMDALGLTWLGDDERAAAGADDPGRSYLAALAGVADTSRRRALVARYQALGVAWATVIHLRAVVSERARVGQGVTIFAGVVVNPGAVLGDHVIVNTGAVIEHDVQVGAFAHVGPAAAVGGGTVIGAGASIGLGARVRDHVRVGDDAVVGMGAVVVADVPLGAVVAGVPARPLTGAGERGRPR